MTNESNVQKVKTEGTITFPDPRLSGDSTVLQGRIPMNQNAMIAPDHEVLLADGTKKRLSEFWRSKPLALIFLRHFG